MEQAAHGRAEQAILASFQLRPVTDSEMKDALALDRESHPKEMFDENYGLLQLKSLPERMLPPKSPLGQKEGEFAVKICAEWDGLNQEFEVESEEQARLHCPAH